MNNESKFFKCVKVMGLPRAMELISMIKSYETPSPGVGIRVEKKVVAKTYANSSGDGPSIREQVMQFATKRKGNVWQLQACARMLNADPNLISPQLTRLCRDGSLERTGRGEYRLSH